MSHLSADPLDREPMIQNPSHASQPCAADISWDRFVASHSAGHILQTSRWSRLKCAFGWKADRTTVVGGVAGISAGCSILFRRLPWGQTLAYAPKGPILDWKDEEQVRELLGELQATCARHRAALLKIEPEMPATPELEQLLADLGFHPSSQNVQPLSTIHINLEPDEETILGRMKPKWRYNVRLAEKKGVVVRQGSASDLTTIQVLLENTGRRDGFAVHSPSYYAQATDLFVRDGLATWLVAEHDAGMLGAIAVFALGRSAWYMWGASSDQDRNLMPNHALQWAAIRWARERGCTTYDLWGIPDEVGKNPDEYAEPETWGKGDLWGVYRFKQGFGGQIVRYIGAWDLPLSAPGYSLYRAALRVRAFGTA